MFFEVWVAVFASDNFEGTFVDFRLMKFNQVLNKELARTLIHVREIFNCRIVCCQCAFLLLGWNFEHSCDQVTFQNGGRSRSHLSKYPFLTLLLNKNIKVNTRKNHGMFIPFKSQVYSKYGSPTLEHGT